MNLQDVEIPRLPGSAVGLQEVTVRTHRKKPLGQQPRRGKNALQRLVQTAAVTVASPVVSPSRLRCDVVLLKHDTGGIGGSRQEPGALHTSFSVGSDMTYYRRRGRVLSFCTIARPGYVALFGIGLCLKLSRS